MHKLIYFFCLFLGTCPLLAQQVLLPFESDEKWGLKNIRMETILQPMYQEIGSPSEGLIAVKNWVGFGYTDNRNRTHIPMKYDYAYPFNGGYALVYLQGKPYLIDKKGKKLFDHPYIHLKRKGSLIVVTTQSGQKGLVDLSGKLLMDTVYNKIKIYPDSIIVAERGNRSSIVDRYGNTIKILNNLEAKEHFVDGLLLSTSYEQGHWVRSIINNKGQENLAPNTKIHQLDYAEQVFSDSMLIAFVSQSQHKKNSLFQFNQKGQGILIFDHTGKLVFQDSVKLTSVHPFENDVAFIKAQFSDGEGYFQEKWVMIYKTGKIITTDFSIQAVCHSSPGQKIFTNGKALIVNRQGTNVLNVIDNQGKSYGVINLNDELKKQNINDSIELDLYGSKILNDTLAVLIFGLSSKSGALYWTIWDTKSNSLSSIHLFNDWKAWDGGNWKNPTKMIDSPFKAKWESNIWPSQKEKFPVWATPIRSLPKFHTQSGIKLIVDTTDNQGNYFHFYIINQSKEPLLLNMNARTFIGLNLQALDIHKNWKTIHYTAPNLDGGDTYQTMLQSGYYWDCLIPQFKNALMITEFRVELKYQLPNDPKVYTLYSETFKSLSKNFILPIRPYDLALKKYWPK